MANSAMEQYFEDLQREKTRELWRKTAEDIGRQEPEVLKMELPHSEESADDQTDQSDQADPDNGKAYFEKVQWHEFSKQVCDALYTQQH